MRRDEKSIDRQINNQLMIGGGFIFALVFLFGGWASLTSIEGAVIAPGTIVVEASRKAIQHDTGGIIKKINVKNGDAVKAGDVLFELDGTQNAAQLASLEQRIFDYSVRRYRLAAERADRTKLKLPKDLIALAKKHWKFAEIVSVQKGLLTSRMTTQLDRRKQLNERIKQLHQEVNGLKEVRKSSEQQLESYRDELEKLKILQRKKLVSISRFNTIKRSMDQLRGELGRTVTEIARAENRISETKLQITESVASERSDILKELETTEDELAQLFEQLRTAKDVRSKLKIRASDDGAIHELAFHTIGGVVQQGEKLAYIVPTLSDLVVDTKVQTIDRDQIYLGMPARVRLSAFSQRTTPELNGKVTHVASDHTTPENGEPPYYAVTVTLTEEELRRLGDLELKPGMPAEALMTSNPRTVISYLVKPLSDQFNRAFRDE